jgi:hypothetical protein
MRPMKKGERTMRNYEKWETHKRNGKSYLCLTIRGGQKCQIVGDQMENYGTYFDFSSFEGFLAKYGEKDLSLGPFA